jgi:hypothetical protein
MILLETREVRGPSAIQFEPDFAATALFFFKPADAEPIELGG